MSELSYFDTFINDCHAEDNTTLLASESGMVLQTQMSTNQPIQRNDEMIYDGSLTVGHLNIRTLVHKHDEFQNYLERINEAYIVELSETWLDTV